METNDHSHLLNAVRQPVAALTAAQVESRARAQDLIEELRAAAQGRPSAQLAFACDGEQYKTLLREVRETVEGWPPEEGVLFLVDQTPLEGSDAISFWRGMNLLREHWGSVRCHVIFLLQPRNFSLLNAAADHLASWIPLKLDLRLPAEQEGVARQAELAMSSRRGRVGAEARRTLEALEKALAVVLQEEQPEEAALIRRFFLPMLEAALDAGDINRAAQYKGRIKEEAVPVSDSARYFMACSHLALLLRKLEEAETLARKTLTDGTNALTKAVAFHQLGLIAQERQDLEAAEKWYRLSLEIKESLRNEYDSAITYHHLGMVAQSRKDFKAAEQWYRKSLEIKERVGNLQGIAATYHQLGNLKLEQGDLEGAEQWYDKSLKLNEQLCNEQDMAITCLQLGHIAEVRCEFDDATMCYKRSLELAERLGDLHTMALNYQRLGLLAKEQHDLDAAVRWYKKCLGTWERLGDQQGVGRMYFVLGLLFTEMKGALEGLDYLACAYQRLAKGTEDCQTVLQKIQELLPSISDQEQAEEILAASNLGHLLEPAKH